MSDSTYPITTDLNSEVQIATEAELEDWVDNAIERYQDYLRREEGDTEWFKPNTVDGAQYVSTSISYDSEQGRIVQDGSGPNYFGGMWSLATCKWSMRGHGSQGWDFPPKFKLVDEERGLYRPTRPVLIYTSTGTTSYNSQSERWLASVALVTHGFMDESDYARFLNEDCSDKQSSHRLTRVSAQDRPIEAVKHGDCHADRHGNTGGPPEGHDHHSGTVSSCGCGGSEDELHKDNEGDHMRCVSVDGFWYAWDVPRFQRASDGRQSYVENKVPQKIRDMGGGVPVEEGFK
jgi:hypothetical protein